MELPKKNSMKRNTSSETGLPRKKYRGKKKKNISSEEEATMTTTMHIPNDVMVEIFSKLHAKALLRFRWVCKYWFKVITDPYFVNMHLNNVNATNNPLVLITRYQCNGCLVSGSLFYKYPPCSIFGSLNSLDDKRPVYMKVPESFTSDSVYVENLGSCNGLVCICLATFANKPYHDKIFIWNPCTREYKMIWRENSPRPIGSFDVSYGFGYDCSTDDYKVIRHICTSNGKWDSLVEVYTVGTNSSKKVPCSGFFFPGRISGLFVNGDLYWIASVTSSHKIIVAFDVVKEEYRQIEKPHIDYDQSDSINLGRIKGCLCVLNVAANWKSVEVWVMKHNVDDMKREHSWDLLYTISTGQSKRSRLIRHLKPLNFCKNGEIAMFTGDKEFILYNPKNNQVNFLRKFNYFLTAETYIESLVSVKGGTYMGQEP